jgi:glycosyltransferase involved in cell wall biosynthesis
MSSNKSPINSVIYESIASQKISEKSKSNLPLVSIITVVFNGGKTLEKTICSVLNQSYQDLEYIIIDGGSTDCTLEIITKYQDSITYWVSEPDRGIYDAMNKGIKAAKGEIIGIINSGDYYTDLALEKVVCQYQIYSSKYPFLIFTGTMYRFDTDRGLKFKLVKTQKCLKNNINQGMPINHPATFVTRETYEQIGLFNQKYRICADYDLIYRAYHSNLVKFVFLENELAYMSLGGVSERFSSLWIRGVEHFLIRKEQVFWLKNLIMSSFWIIKEVLRYALKKILSKNIMSKYYQLRHENL